MKIIVVMAVLVFAGLYFGGAFSGPESALSGMVDCMNEMADVLTTVKDTGTAAEARPKLQALGKRLEDSGAKVASSFSGGDPREIHDLILKYQKPLADAQARFTKELMRVNCIAGVMMDPQPMFAFATSGSSGSA